jgi:hypothetical protein
MISAIEWVPAGVADPTPKKYEFSQAELDLIQSMEEHNMEDLHDVQAHLGRQQEQEEEAASATERKKKTSNGEGTKPSVENTLPPDLRMDEYSSDDDEDDDAVRGTAIGRLLIEGTEGRQDAMDEEGDDGDSDDVEDRARNSRSRANGSDDESDDDDDELADVPDTREYTPVDLEGLRAIGLSQVGTNAPAYMDDLGDGDDENDSEAEDVMIRPDDAIVVVAKTEEVRMGPTVVD